MLEFVGVCPFTSFNLEEAKRDLLLFDRLAIPGLKYMLARSDTIDSEIDPPAAAALRWLWERGSIFEAFVEVTEEMAHQLTDLAQDFRQPNLFTRLCAEDLRAAKLIDAVAIEPTEPLRARRYFFTGQTHDDRIEIAAVCDRRLALFPSARLNFVDYWRPIPLLARDAPQTPRLASEPWQPIHETQVDNSKSTVLQIVLKEFPFPGPLVSFDQILAFRNDPEVRHHRIGLRRWMAETATKERQPVEIANELEYLQSEFRRHMQLHKIESQLGLLRTTVVAAASLAEDLVKIKWGKLAEQLFAFQPERLKLLKAEATAPGREIAYLAKVNSRFQH